jgi:hypothetical protein
MSNLDLFIVSVLRALVEVALLGLIGQGVLALLAGGRRHNNFVYRLFLVITGPVIKVCRWVTPKIIIDKHLPFVAFFLLFWLWIVLAWVKRELCVMSGLTGC